jgi:hypothetical protein
MIGYRLIVRRDGDTVRQFDQETWNALDLLAKDRMQDFQELADEAPATVLTAPRRGLTIGGVQSGRRDA